MAVQESQHLPVPPDSFAIRLLVLRHDRGLTQKEAADICGLDDGSWSNWENGSMPRSMASVVEKIARGLNADRDWLMWGGALHQDTSLERWTPMLPGQMALDLAAA